MATCCRLGEIYGASAGSCPPEAGRAGVNKRYIAALCSVATIVSCGSGTEAAVINITMGANPDDLFREVPDVITETANSTSTLSREDGGNYSTTEELNGNSSEKSPESLSWWRNLRGIEVVIIDELNNGQFRIYGHSGGLYLQSLTDPTGNEVTDDNALQHQFQNNTGDQYLPIALDTTCLDPGSHVTIGVLLTSITS